MTLDGPWWRVAVVHDNIGQSAVQLEISEQVLAAEAENTSGGYRPVHWIDRDDADNLIAMLVSARRMAWPDGRA